LRRIKWYSSEKNRADSVGKDGLWIDFDFDLATLPSPFRRSAVDGLWLGNSSSAAPSHPSPVTVDMRTREISGAVCVMHAWNWHAEAHDTASPLPRASVRIVHLMKWQEGKFTETLVRHPRSRMVVGSRLTEDSKSRRRWDQTAPSLFRFHSENTPMSVTKKRHITPENERRGGRAGGDFREGEGEAPELRRARGRRVGFVL